MKINSINQNSPNFQAFHVAKRFRPEVSRHIMESSVDDLVRILHATTNQKKNPKTIELIIDDTLMDPGTWILRLQGKIKDKMYKGPSLFNLSAWELGGWFKYLGRKAEHISPKQPDSVELARRTALELEDLNAYRADIKTGKKTEQQVRKELLYLISEQLGFKIKK